MLLEYRPLKKTICLLSVCWLMLSLSMPVQGQELGQLSFSQQEEIIHTDTMAILRELHIASRLVNRNPDSALVIAERALKHSLSGRFSCGIITATNLKGYAYAVQSRPGESERAFRNAAAACYYDMHGLTHLPAIYNNMANLYRIQGQFDKAATFYYRAIALAEYLPSTEAGSAYGNLGGVLARIGRTDEALHYLMKAKEQATTQKDFRKLSVVLANIGALHKIRKEWQAADTYLHMALHSARAYRHPEVEALAYIILGQKYLDLGIPEKALSYLQDSLRRLPNEAFNETRPFLSIGIAYLLLDNYTKAEHFLKNALANNYALNEDNQLIEIHQSLANLYSKTGNYPKAFKHHQQYALLRDSLKSQQVAAHIGNLEVKYRSAEKDRLLAESSLKIAGQAHSLKTKNLWIVSISAGTSLLLILSVGIYRSYKSKQRLQQTQIQNLQQEQEILNQRQEIVQLKAAMDGEERERTRIARELHDGIMVQFSAVKMNLSTLIHRHPYLPDINSFYGITKQLDQTTGDLRRVAHNLMPDILLQDGLERALDFFCKSIRPAVPFRLNYQLIGQLPDLHPDFELIVYRITQELMQNVIKHAKATEVLLQLICHDSLLTLTVEDNGVGIPGEILNDGSGIGLKSIRTRVHALNGALDIRSVNGKSTTIFIEFDTRLHTKEKMSIHAHNHSNHR